MLHHTMVLFEMIKVKHTIFAMPFALLGALATTHGIPAFDKILWILFAIITARTAAMTFNRLVDQNIDRNNPRTKNRALPSGQVSQSTAVFFLITNILLFAYATKKLGPLPWKLMLPTLLIILGYSLCKRFTLFSHVILGLSLAIAPLGACIAVNGKIDTPVWFLASGVLTWTAGFDILYALQDVTFDKQYNLYSIPSRVGIVAALWISRGMHIVASGAWAAFNYMTNSGIFPWIAWILITLILAREQWIIRKGNLDYINHVFFTLNSMIGVLFFTGHAVGWLLKF